MANKTVMTAAVSHAITEKPALAIIVDQLLKRFRNKDWGQCSPNDAAANDEDPKDAMGVYEINTLGLTFWIKNDNYQGQEGVDVLTTVLFPSDY